MPVIDRVARWARRYPESRTKQRAGRVFAAAATRFGADAECLVELPDGTRFRLDGNSRTEASTIWNGDYEPEFVRLLAQLSSVYGTTCFDIGANVGLVGIPWVRALPSGSSLVAFEPVAANAARLRANIDANAIDGVVIEAALSDHTGTITMALESRAGAKTGNAIIATSSTALDGYDARSEVVCDRLDAILERDALPDPDVVKLDVEGAECAVLAGATQVLERARPVIFGEFNSGMMPLFGTTFEDAFALLPHDYRVFGLLAHARVREVRPAVGLGDVLLVPAEKVAALPLEIARG